MSKLLYVLGDAGGYLDQGEGTSARFIKLLGKTPFTGINPVEPFCGCWDARL